MANSQREKKIILKVGEWYYGAKAQILPEEATNQTLTWYSELPPVASVNATNGYIKANSVGTTKIYAKAADGSGKKGYIEVTVTDKVKVDSVKFNKNVAYIEKGYRVTLPVTISPENAENKSLEWHSSDETVAVVSGGIVSGLKAGVARITATAKDGSEKYDFSNVYVQEEKLVNNVSVTTPRQTLDIGDTTFASETVYPSDANNKSVTWSSEDESVVFVNPTSGMLIANGEGTATVTATANDGSGKSGSVKLAVNRAVRVKSVEVCPESLTMNVGTTRRLTACISPSNATNQKVTWCSNNSSVAYVNENTGMVYAYRAGTAIITATTEDGEYSDSCELWVKGKTPVFLIHGRTSNSKDVWGINNSIPSGQNKDPNPDINAESLNGKKYIDVDSQILCSFEPNNGDTDYPCNLGNKLIEAGYKENINLFAFNYPNEDAVKYSAQKFEAYINNLISYVRTSGSNEMKACFYASKSDYDNNNYKINIVGHSMGGLVARYYIENMGYMISYNVGDLVYYEEIGYEKHVDKLITICTPHWGSGYADLSNLTGDLFGIKLHALCDHDLDFDSAMYGGSNSTTVNCDKGTCPESNYIVTSALQYQRQRSTKYYAIAGIDYPGGPVIQNDYCFEMSTNYTTYQQIDNFMIGKQVYRYAPSDFNSKSVGDNMVGFMSQIGWTENIGNTPNKKISMEKIFIDVDTNGGNGGGVFIWEVVNGLGSEIFHSKAPHRIPVCNKVIEYLED